MRLSLFLILYLSISFSVAQDIIVFNDGSVKQVKIESFDTVSLDVSFTTSEKDTTLNFTNLIDVFEIKYNDIWYENRIGTLPKGKSRIIASSESFYELPEFMQPYDFTPKFVLTVSARAPNFYSPYSFGIEPELNLTKNLSVKFPFIISSGNIERGGDRNNSFGVNASWTETTTTDPSTGIHTISSPPLLELGQSYSGNNHNYGLEYKIGIAPKYYPLGVNRRKVFYFSPIISFVRMDFGAIDYNYSFKKQFETYPDGVSEKWGNVVVTDVKREDPFSTITIDGLVGFTFNVSEAIGVSLEIGIISPVKNQGKYEDTLTIQAEGFDDSSTPMGKHNHAHDRISKRYVFSFLVSYKLPHK